MTSPPEDNAGPLFSKPDLPEKPGPPNPSPIQEEQDLPPLVVESDKICPPPTSLRSRILEGVLIVSVAAAMFIAPRALEYLQPLHKQDEMNASRIAGARRQAERIVEQAWQYQRAEGRNAGSIAELSRRFAKAQIEASDPWGRDWLVSPAFQDTRTPPNTGDLWACSRGPAGRGRCPPENLGTAPGASAASVGYSARFGEWGRSKKLARLQELIATLLGLWLGAPLAYMAYRLTRRVCGRPAPALRGGLGILVIIIVVAIIWDIFTPVFADRWATKSPLIQAAGRGRTYTVKALLKHSADPNETDKYSGTTALMAAAMGGYTGIVKLLIDNGANVNERDKLAGWTALIEAAMRGHTETVQFLLERGAVLNATTKYGRTPMMAAALRGHTETVEVFLDKGAPVNATNKHGLTALMFAAMAGHTQTVWFLLDKGAHVNAKTENGSTALMLAARGGHTDIVRSLLDKGADVNAKTGDGRTALMFAAKGVLTREQNLVQVVEVLLDRGAAVNARSKTGQTALTLAKKKRRIKIVEVLRKAGAQ